MRNLVTTSNVSATSAEADKPASNLANPSTALRWQADDASSPLTDDQYITVQINSVEEVDELSIAVHNLGTGSNTLSVEGDSDGSPSWTELVEEFIPANDDPIICRFTPQALTAIRLRIQPGTEVPFIACLHVGKLLVMPRSTHQDHTPINLNPQATVMNARSEAGNFLGRIVLSESRSTQIAFERLDADWFRTYMQPFIADSKEDTFWFAWRPQSFPRDVGYCWMTNDPQPSIHFGTDTMSVTLNLAGVAI